VPINVLNVDNVDVECLDLRTLVEPAVGFYTWFYTWYLQIPEGQESKSSHDSSYRNLTPVT